MDADKLKNTGVTIIAILLEGNFDYIDQRNLSTMTREEVQK